ncbi:Uncharacterized protein Adt_25500 [Abeliophyllum distichum]|uniref:Uncharacterized protein n=1 Tax=Abeliophyllum distichum TaxID=126358 RepID=A0ABD1SH83_9LAMI
MSGRTRGRPRIEHSDAPLQEPMAEEQPQTQFATVEQVAVLQNQLSTMMEMLSRMARQPHTSEAPSAVEVPLAADASPAMEILPAVEVLPSETVQTHDSTPSSRHSIPVNWESILNDKVEEAIARRKNRVRPISIKEDPFTEDVMIVPLPPKFKEPTGEFDGTGDPIDHIRIFLAALVLFNNNLSFFSQLLRKLSDHVLQSLDSITRLLQLEITLLQRLFKLDHPSLPLADNRSFLG